MMQFGTGFGGSVVSGLYGGQGSPGSAGQAGQPAASAGPTGRTSLMAAAWGVPDGGEAGGVSGPVSGWIGLACWGALLGLWWVLPR
jgi:hypothetical protein